MKLFDELLNLAFIRKNFPSKCFATLKEISQLVQVQMNMAIRVEQANQTPKIFPLLFYLYADFHYHGGFSFNPLCTQKIKGKLMYLRYILNVHV